MQSSRRNLRLLIATSIIALLILTSWAAYVISWQNGLLELGRYNRQQADQFIGHIESQLARFEFLPELIAI